MKVKRFIKLNKLITIFLGIAIFIIISYMASMNYTEWFSGAEMLFNLFFQLSIGYIINFIFYVTQIYVPNYKRDQLARKCIQARINKIVRYMNDSIIQLSQIYNPGHKNTIFTEKDLKKLMVLKFSDKINARNTVTGKEFSVIEWMITCVLKTESEIDKLYQYYPNYISAQLMDNLEKVLDSSYHYQINLFKNTIYEVDYSQSNDCFFISYYNLIGELEKIKNQEYS